jgi:PIN domain nuclease of toxin-antitoxin system
LAPRFLLDTHIVIRWLAEPKRLSRNQSRTLDQAVKRTEPVAVSDITLLEIAVLFGEGSLRTRTNIDDLFNDLRNSPLFRFLPLSFEIASEIASLGSLRDPADRAIVATARVHRLKLVTSDQRIIESRLVPVIE